MFRDWVASGDETRSNVGALVRGVAAGFGEFQPIDTDRTEEAFGRNRRIELKLTER